MTRASHVLLRLLGLAPGDATPALRLGAAYGLLLASLYMLKPARNSLFLSRVGPAELPAVMCVVAVIGGATALALAVFAESFSVERLLRWLLPVLGASVVAWWVGLREVPTGFLIAAFYVWVNLQGQITTALLWLLAGAVVDARRSRKVFALVGAFGIAGAVCGGAVTYELAPRLGTINLLPLCGLALLAARVSLSGVRQQEAPGRQRWRRQQGQMHGFTSSPLMRVLLLMTLLGGVATSVIDFQFNAVVSSSLPDEDAKTAFFGSFFAYLNVGAFLFQLAFTSRLMARFGLAPSLLVLPGTLGAGGLLASVWPGLATATLLKATDASLRHSLYRSALELLFIPLPARVKRWFRVFLDAAIDNLGTGLGALAVLVVTTTLGMDQRALALLSLGVILPWIFATAAARSAHVEAFRQALEARQLQPEELALDTTDARLTDTVMRALATANERQLDYILDLVSAAAPNAAYRSRLEQLAGHASPAIRAKALAALRRLPGAAANFDAAPLLADADGNVRREAAALLARAAPGREDAVLRTLLTSSDARAVAAAWGAALELQRPQLLEIAEASWVLSLQGPEGEWARRELARVLGFLEWSGERHRALATLARDPSAQVVREAIRSAGQLRDPGMLDFLMNKLGDRGMRPHALEALARYGPAVVPRLAQGLAAGQPLAVQLSMTRVLGRIVHQTAVDCLFDVLAASEGTLRHTILKSLNKLRSRGAGLRFPAAPIDAGLEREVRQHGELSNALVIHSRPASRGERLLGRALAEKRQASFEHVFRLLGLRYLPSDMENAFTALTSQHRRARAHAVEFLDNLLAAPDRQRVLPLIETEQRSERLLATDAEMKRASLRRLMRGSDAWLRACAIYCAARDPEQVAAIRAALSDPDPIVRETAELAIGVQRPEAAC